MSSTTNVVMGYIFWSQLATRNFQTQRARVEGGSLNPTPRFQRHWRYGVFLLRRDLLSILRLSTASLTQVTASALMFSNVCASDTTLKPSNLLPGSIPRAIGCFSLAEGST